MSAPVSREALAQIAPEARGSVCICPACGSGQFPGALPWLNAKVVALLAYVGCGLFALRRGRKAVRVLCFVLALACYAYIVTTARTRDPQGLLALLGL